MISSKKVENMKTLYQQIPRSCRWFYPEGQTVENDSFAELRARAQAVAPAQLVVKCEPETNVNEDNTEILEDLNENVVEVVEKVDSAATKKRKVERPKKVSAAAGNQPAIHLFFGPPVEKTKVNDNNNSQDIIEDQAQFNEHDEEEVGMNE